MIQDKIDKGVLQFPDRPKADMTIDSNPFPPVAINTVAADFAPLLKPKKDDFKARGAKKPVVVGDHRPWLESRKGRLIERQAWVYEVKYGKDGEEVGQSFPVEKAEIKRPRAVKPTRPTETWKWQRVEHPKFPEARNKRTVRRRMLRRRARIRRREQERMEEARLAERKNVLDSSEKDSVEKELDKSAAYQAVYQELEKELGGQDKPSEAENSSQTLAASDFNTSEATIQFGLFTVNLNCSVITLPMTFRAKEDVVAPATVHEDEVIEIPANGDSDSEAEHEAEKIVFHKPEEKMSLHIKPLYIFAYLDGVRVNRIMVDNGAAVNILPFASLRKISKSVDDLIHNKYT